MEAIEKCWIVCLLTQVDMSSPIYEFQCYCVGIKRMSRERTWKKGSRAAENGYTFSSQMYIFQASVGGCKMAFIRIEIHHMSKKGNAQAIYECTEINFKTGVCLAFTDLRFLCVWPFSCLLWNQNYNKILLVLTIQLHLFSHSFLHSNFELHNSPTLSPP